MKKNKISRREFLSSLPATIVGYTTANFTRVSHAKTLTPSTDEDHEILVILFIRGGWDALNVISPLGGEDRNYYEIARPDLKIPSSGQGASLPLDEQFGLHPAMSPLYDLYQDGALAFFQFQ